MEDVSALGELTEEFKEGSPVSVHVKEVDVPQLIVNRDNLF